MLTSLLPHIESVFPGESVATVRDTIDTIQQGHLRWVFKTAKRPQGHWARSFFATGAPKDEIFQLDQQCYPLLELAEYVQRKPHHAPTLADLVRGTVDEILESILSHRAPAAESGQAIWLFETDETPADDEVAFPFHFSSHVLLWHTLQQLARVTMLFPEGTIRSPVAEWAQKVKRDVLRYFVTDHPTAGRIFAYLTSTRGQYQFYHDANDLPTALAPAWGFCGADDNVWLNTLAFAFSPANDGGWYPGGDFGGLGSVHTRDPWPLGDGQDLARRCIIGEQSSLEPVLQKIAAECQFDGMFSEAVDRHSGVVTSKNWFSWPGSFISSTVLQHLCKT
jgi:hypothetical protein